MTLLEKAEDQMIIGLTQKVEDLADPEYLPYVSPQM